MELVLLVFFSHPPARDEAAQRLHFYGRLATTFALWRSRAISESKDHKSGWGYFWRCQSRTLTLTLNLGPAAWSQDRRGAPAMAGECSGTASTISTKVKQSESEAVQMHRDYSRKIFLTVHVFTCLEQWLWESPSWLRCNLSPLVLGRCLFQSETQGY